MNFLNLTELKKERFIKKNLKIESPKSAFIQALIARGGRNLRAFLNLLAKGESLKRALKSIPNIEDALSPKNSLETVFPWDKIDIGVKKEYLWREWQRALKLEFTSSCNIKKCKLCGAC